MARPRGAAKKEPDDDAQRKERRRAQIFSGKNPKEEEKPKEDKGKRRFSLENMLRIFSRGRAHDPDQSLPGPSSPPSTHSPQKLVDEGLPPFKVQSPSGKGARGRSPSPSRKPATKASLLRAPSSNITMRRTTPLTPKYSETESSDDDINRPSTSKEFSQYEISGIRPIKTSMNSSASGSENLNISLIEYAGTSSFTPEKKKATSPKPMTYEDLRQAVTSKRERMSYYPIIQHFKGNQKKDGEVDKTTLNTLRQCVRDECKIAIRYFRRCQLCTEMNKSASELEIFNILSQLKDMQNYFIQTIVNWETMSPDQFILFCDVSDQHYTTGVYMVEDIKARELKESPHLFDTYKYVFTKIMEDLYELEN